jgi:hypothetical protein
VHFALGVCIEKSGGKRAYFSLFTAFYKDAFVGKSAVEFRQTVILISSKRIAEIIPPDVTFIVTVFWHVIWITRVIFIWILLVFT